MYLYCSCRTWLFFIGGEDYTSAFSVSLYFRYMCRLTKKQKMKTQKSWLRISLENWRNMMSRHCHFGNSLETSVLRNTPGFIRYKSSTAFSILLVKWFLFIYYSINLTDSAQHLFTQETAQQQTDLGTEVAVISCQFIASPLSFTVLWGRCFSICQNMPHSVWKN